MAFSKNEAKSVLKITVEFQKGDFFNIYEEQNFCDHMHVLTEEQRALFFKKAAINRSMIENQGTDNQYDKLMGYIQSKGIDYIIQRIEDSRSNQTVIDERRIQDLIRETVEGMMREGRFALAPSSVPVAADESSNSVNLVNSTLRQISETRKKASAKLRQLS